MISFRFSFGLFIINLLIKEHYGESTANHLFCLLRTPSNESCVVAEDDIFKRFNELIITFPRTSLEVVKSENLNGTIVEQLLPFYPVLFHFIPAERLKGIPESTVIGLLEIYNDDVPLALKLVPSLNKSDYNNFFRTLSSKDIRNEVWIRLMKYITVENHYQEQNISLSSIIGFPMLFLPPEFLLQLNSDQTVEYLFYLKPFGDNKEIWEAWLDKQLLLKRIWSSLFIREQYPIQLESWNLDSFNNYNFVMQGMTLEELNRINIHIGENKKHLLSLNWNPLQFRMLFDKITETVNPNVISMYELRTNVFKFLPRQYKQLKIQPIKEIKNMIMKEDINVVSLSLPTSIQLFELMMALEIRKNTTTVNLNMNNSLSYGKLLYSRSLLTLSQFCENPLSYSTLINLESAKLTSAQVYYMTGCGLLLTNIPTDKILTFYGFLRAVPASCFTNNVGEQVNSSIWKHLLNNLPEGNIVLSASILEFVRPHFAGKSFLSDMLANPSNEYFSLLSPVEIALQQHSLRENLVLSKERVENRAGDLPHHILMPLLYKENGLFWEDMYSAYQGNLFINGLTCDDVLSIPSVDFISILSIHSKKRKQFNKVFPKDLQRCVQMAVISYLQLKVKLQKGYCDSGSLLSYAALSDIEIIGGYILATFPVTDIFYSEYSREIISEIGLLSLGELMLTMPKSHLKNITVTYISHFSNNEKIDIRNLLDLGNLTHFVPADRIKNIDPTALKLIIESKYIDTRICADAETREEWAKLLITIFGNTNTWKSDTLLTLNDMLITLPIDDLELVNATSRIDSADLMVSRYYEEIPWYTLKPQPFYQACASILGDEEQSASMYRMSIEKLIKYHLRSIQNLLDGILSSSELAKRLNYYSSSAFADEEYKEAERVTDYFLSSYPIGNNSNDHRRSSSKNGRTIRVDRDTKITSTTTRRYRVNTPITINRSADNDSLSFRNSNGEYDQLSSSSSSSSVLQGVISSKQIESTDNSLELISSEALTPSSTTSKKEEISFPFEIFDRTYAGENSESPSEVSRTVLELTTTTTDTRDNNNEHVEDYNTDSYVLNNNNNHNNNTPSITINTDPLYVTGERLEKSIDEYEKIDSTQFTTFATIVNESDNNPLFASSSILPVMFENSSNLNDPIERFSELISSDGKITTSPTMKHEIWFPFRLVTRMLVGDNNESNSKDDSIIVSRDVPELTTVIDIENNFDNNNHFEDYTDFKQRSSIVNSFLPTNNENSAERLPESPLPSEITTNGELRKTVDDLIDKNLTTAIWSTVDGDITNGTRNEQENFITKNLSSDLKTGYIPDFIISTEKLSITTTTAKSLTNSVLTSRMEIPDYEKKIFESNNKTIDPRVFTIYSSTTNAVSNNNNNNNIDDDGDNYIHRRKNRAEYELVSNSTAIFTRSDINNSNIGDFRNILSDQSVTTDYYVPKKMDNQSTIDYAESDRSKSIYSHRPLFLSNIDSDGIGTNNYTVEKNATENDVAQTARYSSLDDNNNNNNDDGNVVKLIKNGESTDDVNQRSVKDAISMKNFNYELTNDRIIALLKLLNVTNGTEIKISERPRKKSCSKKKIASPTRRKRSVTNLSFNDEINITCNALRTLGPVSELGMRTIDIESMNSEDIFNCLDLFGVMNLTSAQKLLIWNSVRDKELYHVMGGIVSAINIDELNKFNFSIHSSWALEILYLFSQHTDDPVLRSKIIDKFVDENEIYAANGKDFPTAAIIALGPMICELPSSLLQQILSTPLKWSYVWSIFQRIKGCPLACLTKLADIAVNVIGNPKTWSMFDFYMLGPIPAGLKEELWLSLIGSNNTFTTYLAPSAIPCLEPNILKALTEEQLSLLPPTSVYSLTTEQKHVLTNAQLEIVNDILNMKIKKQPLRIIKNTQPSSASFIFVNIPILILFLFIRFYAV